MPSSMDPERWSCSKVYNDGFRQELRAAHETALLHKVWDAWGSQGRQAQNWSERKKWCPIWCRARHGSQSQALAVADSSRRRLWEADGCVLSETRCVFPEFRIMTAQRSGAERSPPPPTCSKTFIWLCFACSCAGAISKPRSVPWLCPAMHPKAEWASVAHESLVRKSPRLSRQGKKQCVVARAKWNSSKYPPTLEDSEKPCKDVGHWNTRRIRAGGRWQKGPCNDLPEAILKDDDEHIRVAEIGNIVRKAPQVNVRIVGDQLGRNRQARRMLRLAGILRDQWAGGKVGIRVHAPISLPHGFVVALSLEFSTPSDQSVATHQARLAMPLVAQLVNPRRSSALRHTIGSTSLCHRAPLEECVMSTRGWIVLTQNSERNARLLQRARRSGVVAYLVSWLFACPRRGKTVQPEEPAQGTSPVEKNRSSKS